MRHIPGSTCTSTSLNNTCPYMRVEKLFPLFLSVFSRHQPRQIERPFRGTVFNASMCVCLYVICLDPFSAVGGLSGPFVTLGSDVKCVCFFVSVCTRACAKRECGSETFCGSWDAHTLLYHSLFFSWQKTSKSFRNEIHLVCKPDAESLYRTSGTCTVCVWYMYRMCLGRVWNMYETCLVHVWTCLGHVWACTGRVWDT